MNWLLQRQEKIEQRLAKAQRSQSAEQKAAPKTTTDGLPVHSFNTLLSELSTLCRVTLKPTIPGAEPFYKLSEPTLLQQKVFELLGITPKITLL